MKTEQGSADEAKLAAAQAAMKFAVKVLSDESGPRREKARQCAIDKLSDCGTTALDAAIAEAVAEVEEHNIRGAIHPDALAKHISAAQQPLVDALTLIRDNAHPYGEWQKVAEIALAKVKETQ